MNNYKFLPYYVGYAGISLAIISGIIALTLYFITGDIGPLMEKILKTVAVLGLSLAVISREKHEDERMLSARWKASSSALTIGGLFILVDEWLMAGPNEDPGGFIMVLMMLIIYHTTLQGAKRF